jgi:hypothetical protein
MAVPSPTGSRTLPDSFVMHLATGKNEYNEGNENILWTPALDNARDQALFRVVCDIWPETENCSAEVLVGTTDNYRFCHSRFQGIKDLRKGSMDKLACEFVEP